MGLFYELSQIVQHKPSTGNRVPQLDLYKVQDFYWAVGGIVCVLVKIFHITTPFQHRNFLQADPALSLALMMEELSRESQRGQTSLVETTPWGCKPFIVTKIQKEASLYISITRKRKVAFSTEEERPPLCLPNCDVLEMLMDFLLLEKKENKKERENKKGKGKKKLEGRSKAARAGCIHQMALLTDSALQLQHCDCTGLPQIKNFVPQLLFKRRLNQG